MRRRRPKLGDLLTLLPGGRKWKAGWGWDDNRAFTRIRELVAALVAHGDQAMVPELQRHLTSFVERGEPYGRDVIGEVLAGIAGPDALPSLLWACAYDLGDDQETFRELTGGLLRAHPVPARRTVEALWQSTNPRERAVAVWALDALLTEQDLPALRSALADPDPQVRITAALPLARLAGPHTTASEEGIRQALAALGEALADEVPQVRSALLNALADTHREAAVPYLARHSTEDPDKIVRHKAGQALRRLRARSGPAVPGHRVTEADAR